MTLSPKKKNNNRGTTIVEALVSILILVIGIIPVVFVTLIANNISSIIKNNLVATNLAQEGIEIIEAIRDANWLANRAFNDGLVPPSFDCTAGCRVEWNSSSLIQETGNNPPLRIGSNGLFSYSLTGTIETKFRRRLFIIKDPTSPGCNCELRVISEVSWPESKRTEVINVEYHLFNWK